MRMHSSEASPSLRTRLTGTVIRIGLPAVGVCLLTFGLLGVVSFAVLPAAEALRSRDWRTVPGVLELAQVSPPLSRLHPPLDKIEIRFRYTLAGVEYHSDRLDPHAGLYLRSVSREVLEGLRASEELPVWVNPGNPADAMVRRDLRLPVLLFALPALAMAVAGGLMLFAGMLAWNTGALKLKRRTRDEI
jgi:hypothetical protein